MGLRMSTPARKQNNLDSFVIHDSAEDFEWDKNTPFSNSIHYFETINSIQSLCYYV